MEPIELNGKVFCSNCGLTIANNGPTTINAPQPTNSPVIDQVTGVTTDKPEEVDFPVIPEVAEATPVEPVDQPVIAEESAPRKVEVTTEEPIVQTEFSKPITEEAMKDLGITPEIPVEPEPETPVLESKIADLTIPSEEDFDASKETETAAASFVELPVVGDEKSTLEAGGLLLDILSEETKEPVVNYSSNASEKPKHDSSRDARTIDPIVEPEIPVKTETKVEDDIYTLPSEVKVGLRNKKVKKTEILNQVQDDEKPDSKIEKKIEKLEEKIAETPEPVVDITPEEAKNYDPDTIEVHDIDPNDHKSKVIKDYFNDAIDRDKKTHKKKKQKKDRPKKTLRIFMYTLLAILITLLLVVMVYTVYVYFKPTTIA